ncbi:MAG: ABC transporter transmembrane domain-containing protein, partial [Pseudomonadota bacterium]
MPDSLPPDPASSETAAPKMTADMPAGGAPVGVPDGSTPDLQTAPAESELPVAAAVDPLAAALVFMTRYFGRPQPHVALVAGLPLIKGRLSVDNLPLAAQRAKLNVEIVNADPSRLDDLALPAIVWMRNGDLRVVVERVGESGFGRRAKYLLADPTQDDATSLVSARELAKTATRDIVFVRPGFDFDRPARVVDTAGSGDWFWSAFRQNLGIFGQIGMGTIIINLLALALPLFMMNVYDRVVPNNAIETLWALGIGVAIAAILDFLLRGARAYMIDVASRRSDVVLANRIYQRLLGVKLGAQKLHSGARANLLREYETVREFFNSFTIATLGDMPFILLFILVVWLIAPGVAIVPTITVPVVLALALLAQLPLNRIVRRSFNDQSNKNSVLFESLGSLETIKSIGAEGWSSAQWERAVAASIKSSVSARIVASFAQNLIIMAQLISTVALVALGVFAIQAGEITAGGLIAAVILNSRALAPLMQIATMLTRMHQAKVAFKALNELMALPVERREAGSYVYKPKFDGAIKLENVSFAYPGSDARVLDDISIDIQPGERVGIIGGIGSGKSTLLRLLMQL